MTISRLKAIIIEDELSSQEHLSNLLATNFPEIDIVTTENAVQQAVTAIDDKEPDIIFLDIAINGGTGFDVLSSVRSKTLNVIFTTAYDRFAIDAFDYNAVDYLLKPLQEEKVIGAVNRCLKKIDAHSSRDEIDRLLRYLGKPGRQLRLPVSTMYGLEFIDIEDILFVEAERNYSKLKLKSGRSILLTKKIKELEEQLPSTEFIRLHNSYLVNIGYVRKYFKGRGGHIILDDGSSIPVSPSRKEHFLNIFQQKL